MSEGLRPSSYNLRVGLPYKDRALVMHGYTGALDIVGIRLADLLVDGLDPDRDLDRDARETLSDRGYLTTKTDTEERNWAAHVLKVFERRQQATVTLGLRLKGSREELASGLLADPPGLFAGLNQLREHHVGGALSIDLSGVSGPLEFADDLLRRAQEWAYTLVVTVTGRQAAGLAAALDLSRVHYVRVISTEPGFAAEVEGLRGFLRTAIEQKIKCDWLVSVAGRPEAEIRLIHAFAIEVKSLVRSSRGGGVNSLLLVEQDEPAAAFLRDAQEPIEPISTSEVALYHHLARFIEMPGLVNLRPHFAPPDTNFVVDSAGIVSTLGRGEQAGQFVRVGRLAAGRVEMDEAAASLAGVEAPATAIDGCAACPFSLVCGVHCGRHAGFGGQASAAHACHEVFRRRLERVAPLVLFNKLHIG